jgi:hypothetical protein
MNGRQPRHTLVVPGAGHFLFVFRAGTDPADAARIAFTDWPEDGDSSPEGYDRFG